MLDTTIEIIEFAIKPEHTKGNVEGLKVMYTCICSIDDEANTEHKDEFIGLTPVELLNIKPNAMLTLLYELRDEADNRFQAIINSQLVKS